MPRRIPDYPDAYSGWNFLASFGSYISLVSLIVFLFVLYYTLIGTDEKKIFFKELPFSKLLKKN
jgi:cytochrome c oxidase subunit 1